MLLPKDPYILLSFLNARLRDHYRYDPVYHQFIPITSKEV